jgi:ribosomal protein S18 acetylase RimI-like enzyme
MAISAITAPSPRVIRKATLADLEPLTDTLCRVFFDDPVILWFFRQDERKMEGLRLFFRFVLLEQTLPFGEVYTTDDHLATLLCTPPGKWKLSMARQMRGLPDIIRATSLKKMARSLYGMSMMEKYHPAESHYYIAFCAVDKSIQRQGVATALNREALRYADAQHCGVYLESTKPENEPLWTKLGFKGIANIDLGKNAPPYLGMWRPAQP